MRIDEATEKPAFIAIASPPTRGVSELEFLIKPVPGSTTEELCALDAGGALQLSPVMGKGFDMSKLPAEDVKTVLLFATGSGISPIKALIETPEDAGGLEAASRSDVRLYYGALAPETMAFRELFEAWEASGVRVIPVFSQACEDEKCYVQHVCREEGVSDGPSTGAVLVGQKEMVQDVKALLAECGMPEENVVMNF
ncbi:hypothetical protein CYMTET_35889 [Cymbomonas tetramitiformis]|uniref:Oxidoreductase FAD/NAD(P)-binding domain-containing protein n=1 Tax=Cymbomonas tetramitiformis TaxID=36881 RepID=A0AAE0KN80_9CHLO|nr:hypothetical protein CYMTET_35889 [Cymbomonas tetramitiformis]